MGLNFSACALHRLPGSQFRSRSNEGVLTRGVHELICPAKTNVNELDVKMSF